MALFTVTTAADQAFDGGDLAAETADGGGLSLREAVALASDGDVINFAAALAGQTLTLTAGELVLANDIAIDGDTNDDNRADITISGDADGSGVASAGDSRIFNIQVAEVALRSLTLTSGYANIGGAIFIGNTSSLDLVDSTVSDSAAVSGGGIYNRGSLEAVNVTLHGNAALGAPTSSGGGIYFTSTTFDSSLVNTTIHDNSAGYGGGGLGLVFGADVTVINSTITGNTAGGAGGGIDLYGGSQVILQNSVVAGNTSGGSADISETGPSSTVVAANSFIGTLVAIDVDNGGNINNGGDAGLGALADNGGTVMTRAIQAGSQLIDAGDTALLPPDDQDIDGDADTGENLPQDANGENRIVGASVDIGAAEFQPLAVVTTAADEAFDGGSLAEELADGGGLSLREAVGIVNALGASEIGFAAQLAGEVLTLTAGELVLNQAVEIDGDIDGDDRADITISGNDTSRIFNIANGTATLRSLTLTDGAAGYGGAIYAQIAAGLVLVDSTVRDSATGGRGGAIYANYSAGGLSISNSLIANNTAAIQGGGIYISDTAATIVNTTIHGNSANGYGGGISINSDETVTIVNSTISSNCADADGSATTFGGGLEAFDAPDLTIANTVFSDNLSGSGTTEDDVSGTIATATNSVFDDAAVTITNSTNNLFNVDDAGLGALADNGGPALTRNIQAGSVLIDAGDNASAAGLATDANGLDRVVGTTVDIGATELGLVVTTAADEAFDFGSLSDELADGGGLSLREAVALANIAGDADTITFAQSLAGQTLALAGGDLALTRPVTINGDVDGDRKADVTISGGGLSQIFDISGNGTVVDLFSLTLTNGNASYGGAVYAGSGTSLSIVDSTIRDSTASSKGGGIYAYSASLTVANSTINGNSVAGGLGYGGGIYSRNGTTTLVNTTITGNSAQYGAGISNAALGGGYESDIRIYNSTVVGNTGGYGLGLYGRLNRIYSSVIDVVDGVVDRAATTFFTETSAITIGLGGIVNGGGDPGLAALADNGGPVSTMSLLPGSAVRDLADQTILFADTLDLDRDGDTAEVLPVDARGQARVVGADLDMGAFESPDAIFGSAAGETLDGTTVHDLIFGLGGNDILRGGAAADHLDGGADFDFASYEFATAGVRAQLNNPAPNTGDAAGDFYASIEGLIGSNFGDILFGRDVAGSGETLRGLDGADTLNGFAGNDILEGGAGGDVLAGGNHFDFASYENSTAGVSASLFTPATNTGDAAGDSYSDIEGLIGSAFDDTLHGNNNPNTLRGQGGNDTLRGFNGVDTLEGGAGSDTLDGGAAGDTLNGGDNVDFASYANSTTGLTVSLFFPNTNTGEAAGDSYISIEGLIGSGLGDNLDGNNNPNTLRGLAGADTLRGFNGVDTLEGGAGGDAMDGGAGQDFASYANSSVGVRAQLNIQTTNTGDAIGDSYISVEGLIGSGFNDFLVGDGGNNELRGGAGNDFLNGLGGIDTLRGEGGTDTLFGGPGGDVLDGGADIDFVSYSDAATGVNAQLNSNVNNTGDATGDTYISIEGIIGSAANDRLVGDVGANILRSGGGNDVLIGLEGADVYTMEAGNDRVVINTAAQSGPGVGNRDQITDWEDFGDDDTIDLSGFAGTLSFIGAAGFSAANQVRAVQVAANVIVQINTVGVGIAEAEIFLANTNIAQVDASDFIL